MCEGGVKCCDASSVCARLSFGISRELQTVICCIVPPAAFFTVIFS